MKNENSCNSWLPLQIPCLAKLLWGMYQSDFDLESAISQV